MNRENNTALIVIVVILLFVGMGSFGMMGLGGYGMMGRYYGGFGGMWLFGGLFMGLVFIALILAVIWLVRQLNVSEERTKHK